MEPNLRIDKTQRTPAYLQLRQQLERAITDGTLAAGQALPSERELADTLGLSRMTVRHAFEELAAEGLVEQRRGSGTYVRSRPLEQTVDRVLGYTDEARRLGFRPGSRLLGAERRAAGPAAAGALGVDPRDEILVLTRLRTADGEPLAIQTAHLPPRFAELSLATLERVGSLYRAIQTQFGPTPHRARQTISARLPAKNERELLGIGRDTPVLALERTTFDTAGRALEFVTSAYRGDRYRLALDLRAPDR